MKTVKIVKQDGDKVRVSAPNEPEKVLTQQEFEKLQALQPNSFFVRIVR